MAAGAPLGGGLYSRGRAAQGKSPANPALRGESAVGDLSGPNPALSCGPLLLEAAKAEAAGLPIACNWRARPPARPPAGPGQGAIRENIRRGQAATRRLTGGPAGQQGPAAARLSLALRPALRPCRSPAPWSRWSSPPPPCSAWASACASWIDEGFASGNAALLDQAVIVLMGVVVLLAAASYARFFLVSWIGERVVADIRKAVFDHIVTLSPAYFEVTRSGEVLSRLTTDTTLLQMVVGTSASIALRNTAAVLRRTGAPDGHQPQADRPGLLVVPLVLAPILTYGRGCAASAGPARTGSPTSAPRSTRPCLSIRTVQAFGHEARTGRASPTGPRRPSHRHRAGPRPGHADRPGHPAGLRRGQPGALGRRARRA